QTYSDTSAGNKIGIHQFLKALGLLDNKVVPINMDDDDNSESDNDKENSDDDQDNYWDWDPRKTYTRWDYQRRFASKNGLFVVFSRSNSFEVLEHNALLNALAHPVKGLNLFDYDELGFDLINN
ncbi:32635_t:CDS:2, partial [Gigaspora margarita]